MIPFIIQQKAGSDRLSLVTVLGEVPNNNYLCHRRNKFFLLSLNDIVDAYDYVSLAKVK